MKIELELKQGQRDALRVEIGILQKKWMVSDELARHKVNLQLEDLAAQAQLLDDEILKAKSKSGLANASNSLHFLDFDKLSEDVTAAMKELENEPNGGAVFLLAHPLDDCGKGGRTRFQTILRERAGTINSQFTHFPVRFGAMAGDLDANAFLTKLGAYLGVENYDSAEETVAQIHKRILDGVSDGSTIYLEITNWHYLRPKEQILGWFFNQFWDPLMQKLRERDLMDVYILCLLEAPETLDERYGPPKALCQLEVPPCKEEHIQRWLIRWIRGKREEHLELAREIHSRTGGRVGLVTNLIESYYS